MLALAPGRNGWIARAASKLRSACSGRSLRGVDQAQPGQRAEMARLQRQRASDVGDRAGIVTHEVEQRRPLVPGLGEVRLPLHQQVERSAGGAQVAACHRGLAALEQHNIVGIGRL